MPREVNQNGVTALESAPGADKLTQGLTAMGHTVESYAERLFRLHLLGGIESAAGLGCPAGRR